MAKKKQAKQFSVNKLSSLIDDLSEETQIIIDNEDKTEFIDTGVYIMNALLSKSIKTGGVASDRITIFAGKPNTGKSYLMYNVARNAQKEGYFVLFIDTEHSVSKQGLESFGIETGPDKLKLTISNKVEDLKIFLTKFLNQLKTAKKEGQEVPKVVILLDSIGMLASEKEIQDSLDGKNKVDMTRAKAIKQFFRIISSDLGYLKIPMIASNHVYEDTNSFFPTEIMAGGKGTEYSASTIVFLSSAKLKTGREDDLDLNSTGALITAQAKKNRMAKPKKIKFEIDHEYGTNPYKGLEYFCTSENFEKIGIGKGKKVEKDGKISLDPGGTRWYVRHLDKSFYEKQMFNSDVFNQDVLDSLEPIIYKYFDYSSFEDQQEWVQKMDSQEQSTDSGQDFDELDSDDLFG